MNLQDSRLKYSSLDDHFIFEHVFQEAFQTDSDFIWDLQNRLVLRKFFKGLLFLALLGRQSQQSKALLHPVSGSDKGRAACWGRCSKKEPLGSSPEAAPHHPNPSLVKGRRDQVANRRSKSWRRTHGGIVHHTFLQYMLFEFELNQHNTNQILKH